MTHSTISVAADWGTDLSSRQQAAELRRQVVGVVEQQGVRQIDLGQLRSVSHSFADELFGVLALKQGEIWFQQKLRLLHLTPYLRQTILEVIASRLENRPSRPVNSQTGKLADG